MKVSVFKLPLKELYWEPQTGNPKNIVGIYLPGSLYSSIFLLYSWGSLFGVPSKVPLSMRSGDPQANPKALRTHLFKAFGPKDHTMKGCWATLSLRDMVKGLGV